MRAMSIRPSRSTTTRSGIAAIAIAPTMRPGASVVGEASRTSAASGSCSNASSPDRPAPRTATSTSPAAATERIGAPSACRRQTSSPVSASIAPSSPSRVGTSRCAPTSTGTLRNTGAFCAKSHRCCPVPASRARVCPIRSVTKTVSAPTTGGAITSNVAFTRRLQRWVPSARSSATTDVSDRPAKIAKALPWSAEIAETTDDRAEGSCRHRSSPVFASSATTTGWVSPSPCRPTSTVASITVIGVTSIASSSRRQSTLPSARSTEITVPPFTPTNADPSSTVTPVRLTPSSGTGGHSRSWLPRSNAARPDSTRPSPSASAGVAGLADAVGLTSEPGAGGGPSPHPSVYTTAVPSPSGATAAGTEGPTARSTANVCSPEPRSTPITASGPTATATSPAITGAERPKRSPGPPGSNGVLHARRYPGSGPSVATPVFDGPPWNSVQAPATWPAATPAPSRTGAHTAAATVRRARRDDRRRTREVSTAASS